MTYQDIKTALKSFQSQGKTIPPLNSKKEVLEAALAELQASIAVVEPSEEITEVVPQPIEDNLVEYTITIDEFVDQEGSQIEVSYISEEISTKRKVCQSCGDTYILRGFSRMILDQGTCEKCKNAQPIEEIQEIEPEPAQESTPVVIPPADIFPLAPSPRPVVGWQLLKLELTDDLKFVGTVLLYAFSLLKYLSIKATPYIKKALNFALRVAVYGVVAFKLFILPKIMVRVYLLGIWGVTIALRVVRGRQWSIA